MTYVAHVFSKFRKKCDGKRPEGAQIGESQPDKRFAARGIRTEITGIRAEIPVPIPVLTACGAFWPHHSPLRLILSPIYAEWRKEKKTNGGLAVERGMNNCYFRIGAQALKGGCSKK